MLKRIMAFLMAMAMVFCAAVSVAETPEEALRAVTLLAKERCGISDDYATFEGDVIEWGAAEMWSLMWMDEKGEKGVNLTCDAEGYPYDFYRYDFSDGGMRSYVRYYEPHYPQWSREECTAVAEAFLEKALHENEGYVFTEEPQTLSPHQERICRLFGYLTRDGIRMDVNFGITVETGSMQVETFYREDGWLDGGVNEAEPTVTAEEAEQQLEAMVSMEMEYVSDGENSAVLRYFPRTEGDFSLNAVTGEVIDWSHIYYGYEEAEAAADMRLTGAGAIRLTEAESAGAKRLEGVMTREALDEAVRAMTMLGVTEDYELYRFAYITNEEKVNASLEYRAVADKESYARLTGLSVPDAQDAYTDTRELQMSRTVTVDAFTGKLVHAASSGGDLYGRFDLHRDEENAQARAAEFLAAYDAEHADSLSLVNTYVADNETWYEPQAWMNFVRMENGVPFPEDRTTVVFNMATGYVDAFSQRWSQETTFEPVEGVIGEEAAYAAYCQAAKAELVWRCVPDEPWLDYESTETLTRCYDLTATPVIAAIGAKDGLPVAAEKESELPVYNDLGGHQAADAAQRLAAYFVGFPGGSLKPEKEITLFETVCLLLQAGGNTDPWDADIDDVRSIACGEWILTGKEDLYAAATRGQLCVMLLRMSGYANAAKLSDAFRCGFADADTFGADVYGYYALAEALGVAEAKEDGRLVPEETLTRGEAVMMLDRFLSR